MHFRQKLRTIPGRARAVSKHVIKTAGRCVEWTVTLVVVIVMSGVAVGTSVGKLLYQERSRIVGALLLVGILLLLLLWATQLVGFKDETNRVHGWLVLDYHWVIITGAVSFLVLTTWNYVSPTLRMIFKSWGWIGIWVLVSGALIVAAHADLPQKDIAYRSAYAGIVIFYIATLAAIAKVPPKGFISPKSSYIEDNPEHPINSIDYETQKRVIADIKFLIGDGRPSIVAVSGRWGVGKTYVLRCAKEELLNDRTIIWMDFEPWRYTSEEAITLGFYQGIGVALKGIPGVQNITKPLAGAADKFIRQRDGTGLFGALMDAVKAILYSVESPDVQIQKLLERERKRLVIVVDDVERSYSEEAIFRTLQLAHYVKNKKNIQVVFLYDKEIVLKAIPEHLRGLSHDGTEYLEKFVEREVVVPSPQPSELRKHFTALMEVYRDEPGFDFSDDDLPEDMLNAVGTPRGIIRLFNEFAAFRVNLDGGDNPDKDIRTKDLITMAFLKTKYWGLYRDVEVNRDVYTQVRFEDPRAFWLFDPSDEQEHRKNHFNELFNRLGYGTSDMRLLRPLLSETFPDWQGKGHTSDDELRAANRIGHRDLLDLYFSYGISYQAFKERMEHVTPIIERIAKGRYNENSLTKQFREFNRYALSQEKGGDVARLLARNLLRLQQQQTVPVTVWRCWLRALLKYESGTSEAANAVLASILSGANDSIQRTLPLNISEASDMPTIIGQRVDGASILFEDITAYLSDAYVALLLLLFVLPARGNSFFADYINRHGVPDLYMPVLSYVDKYFMGEKRNVFREYSDSRHWRFILYQWSLSISQGREGINRAIKDAQVRQKMVNDYVFNLLKGNPKLIYKFIHGQFLTDGDQGTGVREWHIADEMKQYSRQEDREHIAALTHEALSSKELTTSQKEELVEFNRLFNQFINQNSL